MSSVLITGAAGFIGYHLYNQLKSKHTISGIDILYPQNLLAHQRASLVAHVQQKDILSSFIEEKNKPDVIVHLAAETGISGSLTDPGKYFDTNVKGTFNVLEQCRQNGIKFLIYASSSSVYSPGQQIMFESGNTQTQLSFYGTTKKMTEQMVANYCHQFGITAIGLRFFTVYGSWTRPDMAAFKFMNAIKKDEPVVLYNEGNVFRDFTHVSDIVKSIELLCEKIQHEQPGTHQLFNIGFGEPVSVKKYAETIAEVMKKEVKFSYKPLPVNELQSTQSDTNKLNGYINYKPQCNIDAGIQEMVEWFNIYSK